MKQAEAYGGMGERVQKSDELRSALNRALQVVAAGKTFLLDVVSTREEVSPSAIPSPPDVSCQAFDRIQFSVTSVLDVREGKSE